MICKLHRGLLDSRGLGHLGSEILQHPQSRKHPKDQQHKTPDPESVAIGLRMNWLPQRQLHFQML